MKCDIVSARRTVHSGEVTRVFAPGIAGELGIAPRHAPLLTTLKAGALRVVDENQVVRCDSAGQDLSADEIRAMLEKFAPGEKLDEKS